MLRLYHSSTSVCAIKVRLVLAEKGLDWESELLSLQRGDQHRPDYAALNPNQVVPTLIDDGRVLIESTLIVEYLEERFPAPPLMPSAPFARFQARYWMRRIDDLHPACSTLSSAAKLAHAKRQQTPDQIEAYLQSIPQASKRERQRALIADGYASPHVAEAVRRYDRLCADMERALTGSAYLAGPDYSLADAAATPYLLRAETLAMEPLWERRPRLAAWLERMQGRASFEPAIARWVGDDDKARYEVPREETWRQVGAILAAG